MHQQRIRFLVSVGVVFLGVLGLSRTGLAQPGDGHGGVSRAYRDAANTYRQMAANSPAHAACYRLIADYYEKLSNYQSPPEPDMSCLSAGGTGSGGGMSGTSPLGSSNSVGTGRSGGSTVEAALDAAAGIFRSLGERQEQERLQRREQEQQAQLQREQTEGRQASGDGAGTGPGCMPVMGGPMVEAMMKDARRRTGNCQQSPDPNAGGTWLNEGVPGTAYSSAPACGCPSGRREFDPFRRVDEPVIDGSNIPSTIEFPGRTPRPGTNAAPDRRVPSNPVKDDDADWYRQQLLKSLPEHPDMLGNPIAPAGQRELDPFFNAVRRRPM